MRTKSTTSSRLRGIAGGFRAAVATFGVACFRRACEREVTQRSVLPPSRGVVGYHPSSQNGTGLVACRREAEPSVGGQTA